MSLPLRVGAKVFLSLCVTPYISAAQTRANWDLSVDVMGSPAGSKPGFFFGGQVSGMRQSGLAVRAGTDLVAGGPVHLRYTAQLMPAIILSRVEQYQLLEIPGRSVYVLSGSGRTYGVGLSPIGLQLAIDATPRVRLQFGAAAGVSVFTKHIPTAGGARRNFSAEWDAAIRIAAGRDRWIQAGLRWMHISNGFTAFENLGVDNRMIVIGYTTRIGRRR
jgi:Lipid A 3-O-deacylase (PagL)